MIRQYRKQWLRWHNNYERTARIIFQRTFKEIAKDIPFERMSAGTYKAYLQTHVSKEKIFDSYVKVYSEIGTKHGKRVGVQINKQINEKNFTIDGFLNEFQRTLINFLATNEGSRITTVRQSYIQYLTQIMTKGIEEGKTMSMISTDMTKLVKSRNFYRWQALRIARTETTAASNYAATVSSSVSGVLMDKVWVSALDARTRREPESHFDHYHMNQVKVPLDKPFDVSGEKLMFPGDPKGSAGNVINCRCSVAQVVRRDANGNIMRVEDKTPVIDNIPYNVFPGVKTLKEAEQWSNNYFKQFNNSKTFKADFSGIDINLVNKQIKQLEKLTKEYRINGFYGIETYTKRGTLAKVTRIPPNNDYYLGYNSFSYEKEKRLVNGYRDAVANGFSPKVNLKDYDIATTTHEFAHMFGAHSRKINQSKEWWDFRKELLKINKDYKNSGIRLTTDKDYISEYAKTNLDEFMAESFLQYKLSDSPSKYATRVGNLIDKYFKK